MSDQPDAGVHIVRAGDLSDQTPQTSGLKRFEAVSARRLGSQDLWMGLSVLPAGSRTGVHHHGRSETALYVLSGVGRWWIGDRLDTVAEAHPGDFVYIEPDVVHWEENASATEPVRMIVARTTQDAIVVNLDDHPYGPELTEGRYDHG
ncbi:cupin domain-containing protein [Actinoplanes sp. TRM 88003]|uniref:Cupin domain-containing protein n=1 Tax=Paractinoplanes aksuensis TaxID=2939490 RepID=A0ABT1E0M9_9ACTN|nr:cupin domain-containing protein [Actinoplanes aksuensis]MCO8276664.1 cupin domain-containing protein [Actinoplanes aksuensis]